jgi:hypothetical protein
MVFVDTPLEEMLSLIQANVTPKIIDCIKPASARGVLNYQKTYENHLRDNISDRQDVLERLSFESSYSGRIRLSAVVMLIENSLYRGYDGKKRLVEIGYYFGENGVLFQVKDKGKGFDVSSVLEGFKQGKPIRGVHFQTGGVAFNTLNLPEFQAVIESSQRKPTGTNVYFMYEY